MVEAIRPQPDEVQQLLKRIHYPQLDVKIQRVFPGYFSDRCVFSYIADKTERVIKLRPDDEKAEKELHNMRKLETSFRLSGAHFAETRGMHLTTTSVFVLDMPYLGETLVNLASKIDLIEYGYKNEDEFRGFSAQHIAQLLHQFERDHMNFSESHGLIHGDIYQHGAPNNILWHPTLNKLFLIDGESLSSSTDEKRVEFLEKLKLIEEWMYESLLVSAK